MERCEREGVGGGSQLGYLGFNDDKIWDTTRKVVEDRAKESTRSDTISWTAIMNWFMISPKRE